MAITKTTQPVTALRTHELVKEFNYGERILEIYKLEEARQAKRDELDAFEAQIKNLRSELPEDVVTLYDEYRTCMKLRGETLEPAANGGSYNTVIGYQYQYQMQHYNQGFQDFYLQGLLNQINQKFI